MGQDYTIVWVAGHIFFSCRVLVSLNVVVVKRCVSGCWKSILRVTWLSLSVNKEKKEVQTTDAKLYLPFLTCLSFMWAPHCYGTLM